jgi:hypothetical protein
MPNFDGGHFFLSSLIPIREGLASSRDDPGNSLSHIHAIREILTILPTENPIGDAGTQVHHYSPPFSRDLRTHFCRMVVIDDLVFVGRQHQDAIVTAIRKINPVIPGPVDHLPQAYLAFIADFDAPDGSLQSLRDYLYGLWQVMAPELTEIFQHCIGFDHDSAADSFVKQVTGGQIETTMSFNDYYWQGEPGLWQGSPPLPNKWPKVLGLPLATAALAGVAIIVLAPTTLLRFLLIAALLAATILWLIRRVITVGMEPFPAAPRADLRSVLKALYLQRNFIDFMIDCQGCDSQSLQAKYLEFVARHQPSSIDKPTQTPGSIPS